MENHLCGLCESEEFDQTLDTVLVGPLKGGKHKFVFQAEPPDVSRIPLQDAVGVTVVLLTCGYKNQEFIRVGYYVNNEYGTELKENPPTTPDYEKLQRNILATCPRVTRFRIDWGDSGENSENVAPMQSTESESNQMASETSSFFGKNSEMMAAAATSTGAAGRDMLQNGHPLLGGSTIDANNMHQLANLNTVSDSFKNTEESMDMC